MNHNHNHWFRSALIGVVFIAVVLSLARYPDHTTQAQTGGTVGYGSKVSGSISADLPRVTYSFTGSAGDFVTIIGDSWAGALQLQAELVAPDGLVLGSSIQNAPENDSTGAYLSSFLPDAGVYLLRITGENNTAGDFVLTLLGRPALTPTPLEFGQAVEVTIPTNPSPQYFSFETEDCPTTLTITNLSPGQPFSFPFVLKVRDQRGQMVAALRGGEQIEDWVTVAPRSGRYEVELSSADPALNGIVRLLVTCSGDNPGCPAGQSGSGAEGGAEVCLPCFSPGDPPAGGGCPDLNLTVQQGLHMPAATTVSWDPMPGAEGYSVRVTGITTDGGDVYLTHADWIPGNPTEFTWILPVEGYIGYRFTLEVLVGGAVICTQSQEIMIGTPPEQHQNDIPCEIMTQRRDVTVRVGPGLDRGVFDFLPPNQNIRVVGMARDGGGNIWWQIDKSQIPGGDAAISLWVAASDVIANGNCDQVPETDIPLLVPDEQIPDQPDGSWGPCGSCDSCGHPASECVTSPEGLCLWDPATCQAPPPDDGGGECYAIRAAVDYTACPNITPAPSAMIDTVPNCEGGHYLPGTTMQAHAVAVDPKCHVVSWSGCGASGTGSSVTFTASSNCTVTAHMSY